MKDKKEVVKDGKLTDVINDLEERARALRADADALEKQLSLARGTRELTEKAAEVTLAVRMEQFLRGTVASDEEIARALDIPIDDARAEVKRAQEKLTDVGTQGHARWTWRVGEQSSTEELRASIEALISHQPMSFR